MDPPKTETWRAALFYDVKATSILSALHCSKLLIDYLITDPEQVSLVVKAFLLTSSWALGKVLVEREIKFGYNLPVEKPLCQRFVQMLSKHPWWQVLFGLAIYYLLKNTAISKGELGDYDEFDRMIISKWRWRIANGKHNFRLEILNYLSRRAVYFEHSRSVEPKLSSIYILFEISRIFG